MMDLNYVPFAVHDAAGRILRYGTCVASDVAKQARAGEAVLLTHGAPVAGMCVVGGVLTPQTELSGFGSLTIAADGVAAATMVVPDPCEVWIDGRNYMVTGGLLALTADYPGIYRVLIDHPRHRLFEAEVTAR